MYAENVSISDEDEDPAVHMSNGLEPLESFVAESPMLERIAEISGFSLVTQYLHSGALLRGDIVEAVAAAVLQNLAEALAETKIQYLHSIKVTKQRISVNDPIDDKKPVIDIAFQHPVFDFSIRIFDDRFVIVRTGSSFRDFYRWYCLVFPHIMQMEATVRQAVARKYGQPLKVTQNQFEYKFIFSDFSRPRAPKSKISRNVDVLSKFLPTIPNGDGNTELARQDFTRLDITFSRLEQFGSAAEVKSRNCWYMVEAPFNEGGRFIVLTAQLRNVAVEEVDRDVSHGERVNTMPFDDDFSMDYRLAMVDFLKPRALDDFMGALLGEWDFRTQREI